MEKNKIYFIQNWSNFLLEYCRIMSNDVAIYVACQFALESNFGTSNLSQTQNNISGMKRPLVRPTCSLETNGQFASYESVYHCVLDFLFCLAFHKLQQYNLDTIKHYIAATEKWYCPERDYHSKIQFIYLQFQNSQKDEQNK